MAVSELTRKFPYFDMSHVRKCEVEIEYSRQQAATSYSNPSMNKFLEERKMVFRSVIFREDHVKVYKVQGVFGNYGERVMALKRADDLEKESELFEKICSLNTPYVVQHYGFFPLKNKGGCILMSYHPLDLCKLQDMTNTKELNFSIKHVHDIAYGVLSGLKWMFEKVKIVHLDLKESNILIDVVTQEGEQIIYPRIADFEHAEECSGTSEIDPLTKQTLPYRSPYTLTKRLENNDQYSVGVIIMQLLTGYTLFSCNGFLKTEEAKKYELLAKTRLITPEEEVSLEEAKMRFYLTRVFNRLGYPTDAFKAKIRKELMHILPQEEKLDGWRSISEFLKEKRDLNEPEIPELESLIKRLLDYENPPTYDELLGHSFFVKFKESSKDSSKQELADLFRNLKLSDE